MELRNTWSFALTFLIFIHIITHISILFLIISGKFSSVQSLSHIQLFVTPWTAAHQASLSITIWSSLRLMSMESVMPSSHLIVCLPLLLPPSIFPSIRVFSNDSGKYLPVWATPHPVICSTDRQTPQLNNAAITILVQV